MSRLKILTSFNIELDFEIPDFHLRMFAWMIDVVILIAYAIFLEFLVFALLLGKDANVFSGEDRSAWLTALVYLLWGVIPFYPLICELTMNGQSFGKKALGIRVINETGGNASVGQFIIRWMLRMSDLLALGLILTLIWRPSALVREGPEILFFFGLFLGDILCIIISKKSQRLGDLAAGTLMINLRTKTGLEETVFMETEDNYVPLFPEVMRLSDRDLNIIKSVYSSVLKRNDYALAERTAAKIETALKIQNKQHPLNFLETLLKDYNYLSTR